jgi:hypothetical protein
VLNGPKDALAKLEDDARRKAAGLIWHAKNGPFWEGVVSGSYMP